ncbi:MAG: adenylate/guanylate cyclase domain-containing protein [Gemmatimonadota bacterium]
MQTDPTAAIPGVSCPACATENSASGRFCHHCGAHLIASVAERRIITVLFADLSGFTRLTEQLDAEQVHSLITTWLDPLCEAVIRWGGFVDKFIGDCVMALFGAPTAYENEPERAVRAALDMHAAFDQEAIIAHAAAAGIGGYRPRLSIGVNTGPVVTGMFSSGNAWDYTAVGDTVNVAARLQGICEPGDVLVGEATHQQTRHLFEFGDEQILQVKGRSELVTARRVTGVSEVRGEVRGFAGVRVPLVGREAELERLRERWRQSAAGDPQVCLLLGAAGIGKSRLVEELAAAEELADRAVIRGRSHPYASSTPWEPVAELIRSLHHVGSERSAPEAVAAIAEGASESWPEDELAGLGAVLGSPVSDLDRLEGLPPEERRDRMVGAVARALEQGVVGPTLLVLEDLHWADRTTLDFLRSIPDLALRGPFLLVLVSRPALPAEQAVADLIDSIAVRIELPSLSLAETTDMIGAILSQHELPAELLALIHDRSGGNPLFVEEIIKALTTGNVVAQEGDVWRAAEDYREFTIPDSIDSVITTRIDGLGPAAKKVLQYAAIVGRRFWTGAVGEALGNRPVERELDDLMKAALVRVQPESVVAGDTEYSFEHLLLQEVAYAGLLRGVRSELHGTVAAWLGGHLAGQVAEYDGWVAYHFERSNEPARALPYLDRAIADAWERGALLDAEGLIDRALAVAEELEDKVRLYCLAEEVATAIGNDAQRLAAIDQLAVLAESEDHVAIRTVATFRRARRLLDIGKLDEARAVGEMALDPFRQLGDESAEADVLALLGRVAHLWGSYEEALDYYRAALPLERRAGDRLGEAEILRSLGLAEVDFGNFTRALDYFDQALGIYAEINNRPGQALALANRASAFRWLGRYKEAEETARHAEDMARGCSSRSALAAASLARAIAIGAAGRVEEAKALLYGLVEVAPALHRSTLEARAWLALGELESGRPASDAAQRARDVASSSGLIDIEVLGLSRLAELALEADDTDSADQDSERALKLLELHGDIQGPDEVVYYTRSRVLAALGRLKEARATRERAREIIRETASWIDDEESRRSFLENVDPNPEIMAPEAAG